MRRFMVLMLLVTWSGMAAAGDPGTVAGDADLYTQPGGSVQDQVRNGALVTIEQRQGGWYQVRLSDGRTGYLRISQVRFTEQEESESVFGGLWSWLNSSRQSSYGSTTTAGIRGMSEDDIVAAKPDLEAVGQLDSLAVAEGDARLYAAELSLKSRDISELD